MFILYVVSFHLFDPRFDKQELVRFDTIEICRSERDRLQMLDLMGNKFMCSSEQHLLKEK